MKDTGIIRKIDGLGRIGVPKEIRDIFGLIEKRQCNFMWKEKELL